MTRFSDDQRREMEREAMAGTRAVGLMLLLLMAVGVGLLSLLLAYLARK